MRTVQTWTCELGYGADTMFHRTYFLFCNVIYVAHRMALLQMPLNDLEDDFANETFRTAIPRTKHSINVPVQSVTRSLR